MKDTEAQFLIVIVGAIVIAGYNYFTKNQISTQTIFYYALLSLGILLGYLVLFLIMKKLIQFFSKKKHEKWERQIQARKERKKQEEKAEIQQKIQELKQSFKQIKTAFSAKPNQQKITLLTDYFDGLYQTNHNCILDDGYSKVPQVISKTVFEEITKTKEILKEQQKAKEKQLDLEKGIHKETDLDKEQIKILEKQDYVRSRHVALGKEGPQVYYIRPRANESTAHYFLTMQIKQYLESKSIEVRTPNSREADIIFTANNQTWAIEVETGSVKKKKPEMFKQKIEQLNKKYGDNWFIVLTKKDLKKHYRSKRYKIVQKSKIIEKIDKIIGDYKF